MARTLFKPAGLTVLPPHGDPSGDCLVARLLAEEPERSGPQWPRGFDGGVAHRLDVSTSGALWVADDPDELERMRALFKARALVKTYRFLAAREVPWDDNRCDRPLAGDRRHKGRVVVQRGGSTPHRGRWSEASTVFTRIEGNLWRATMRRGTRHQIRAHGAFVGIPLLGDRRYGGGPTPEGAPEGVEFFLHHVGLVGPGGWGTDAVPLPGWAAP